ncbi:hypothetical protein PV392_08760 [Streptomyces sp. ME03-5709C]|nr:hypothetical protein [Streptomyces sp. ME03-5709C]
MTAVAPVPRPPVLRGLPWSVVRLHRVALWLWIGFVVAGSGLLLWSYRPGATTPVPGSRPFDDFTALHLTARLITLLPLAVAAFAGGALIGRELENGTAALAWTQSVSPSRWLAARLAVPALLLTAGTAALCLVFRWAWTSGDAHRAPGWYERDVFLAGGPAGLAYVLLGLALGVLSGLLMRRALSGLGLAFFATLLPVVTLAMARSHLWPTTRWTGSEAARLPVGFDRTEVGVVTAGGKFVPGIECAMDRPGDLEQCLRGNGWADVYSVGHPASHYWPLQLVETGIVLALAALACWACFALLRRRTA